MNTAPIILIIEDEIILQNAYKLVLSSKGYTIYTANNGSEGLAVLADITPDVILLDIFMPVMDGREFLKTIDLHNYPDTKIIVYTNLTDANVKKEMMDGGAYKFILKSSMTPRDLLSLVEECLPDTSPGDLPTYKSA
jgi:CheY-like chemotaxis protein